jgi:hypothetical protein
MDQGSLGVTLESEGVEPVSVIVLAPWAGQSRTPPGMGMFTYDRAKLETKETRSDDFQPARLAGYKLRLPNGPGE